MRNLDSWEPGLFLPVGAPVKLPLDLLALLTPDGQIAPIVPGERTNFKGIDFNYDAAGKKVHGQWWPGERDGTGPAYTHTWETWPLPEPEPVPLPHPFVVTVAPDGAGLLVAWMPMADVTTEFRIGDVGTDWELKPLTATPAGETGVAKTTFVQLLVSLADGQSIEVQAQAVRDADSLRSAPSAPVVSTYTVAKEPDPEPLPDPDPPLVDDGTGTRVELWRPTPFMPTPWGSFALFIGKRLPAETEEE
jgi:hypothetical protein